MEEGSYPCIRKIVDGETIFSPGHMQKVRLGSWFIIGKMKSLIERLSASTLVILREVLMLLGSY